MNSDNDENEWEKKKVKEEWMKNQPTWVLSRSFEREMKLKCSNNKMWNLWSEERDNNSTITLWICLVQFHFLCALLLSTLFCV